MNRFETSHRSRRRRASFALFGRPRSRTSLSKPEANGVWQEAETARRATPDEKHLRSLDPARLSEADQANLQAIVARLQREARADARLKGRLLEADLNQLVEQHVRVLWAESRVTAYVPLLAMRRIYEELDLVSGVVPAGEDA